jgi:UDP-N-acetylmuramoyl-tripeptide--D-alanyl-D-alanine ligase
MTIAQLYDIYLRSNGVATDSRKAVEGKIFFALKGPNFNGHQFVDRVLAEGALLAIVDEDDAVVDNRTILVRDTLLTLQNLARHHRICLDIPVYAITGSNGKTTTRELLDRVLSEKYSVHTTKGNFNNLLGLPLTILEANSSHELLLLEMGSNAFGEIARLCEIALPDYGIITNIGAAHLEGFVNHEGVLNEKTSLYRAVQQRGGYIFVPRFSEELMLASDSYEHRIEYDIGHSFSEERSYCIEIESVVPRIEGVFVGQAEKQSFSSSLAGHHNAQNCAAAIAIGLFEKIEAKKIAKALASYTPENNRSQQITREDYLIILDAYNANPVSMNKALDLLQSWPASKRIAILGDMKELGGFTDSAHQEIVQRLQSSNLDAYFLVGSEMKKATQSAYPDADSLMTHIKTAQVNFKDSVILIKGSRSMGLERLLDCI